ncbi:ABC transporter permease [Cohnella sp. AR92]|uniref:ABC transporter permease n=1 Tax=Cohnella sp. AR92 TaxID=648716 RepID=UPI000F8D61E4|nr:ABC transporter permease [Cohnella sp. AR92]RUS43291.1 ABC transporter permease [Cohnella sp. AR92]
MKNALAAELSKLLSLPAIWIAVAVGILVAPAIAVIRSFQELFEIEKSVQTAVEYPIGFEELGFGVMGVIIVGVIAISSEYFTESEESGGGRQLTTSLTANPSRIRFLMSKASAVATVSAILAIIAIALTLVAVRIILAEHAPELGIADISRFIGVVCYWVLTALMAFGITILTRHAALPMAVLLLNTSVVSVTYLLTRVTPLANYLPDMAGIRMFVEIKDAGSPLTPIWGGVVMAAWVTALLSIGTVTFCRRDL